MDSVTLDELIKGQLLKLPEDQLRFIEVFLQGNRFSIKKGVYVFYNKFAEPLYVGISNKINSRVLEHVQSPKGNPDLQNYLKNNSGCYIKVFSEPDKTLQEIYEGYLIKTLAPRYNIGKTGRQKYGTF